MYFGSTDKQNVQICRNELSTVHVCPMFCQCQIRIRALTKRPCPVSHNIFLGHTFNFHESPYSGSHVIS